MAMAIDEPMVLVQVRYRRVARVLEFALRKIDAVPLSGMRTGPGRRAAGAGGLRTVQPLYQFGLVDRQAAARDQLLARGAAFRQPDRDLVARRR